ncbi:MAG: DMT family transporter [Alkalispirochaetaceae bacterium]
MEREQAARVQGVALIILAAALWGALGVVARVAFAEGLEPLEVAVWRASIGWVFFAVHAAVRREPRIARRDIPQLFVFAIVSVSGFFGSYQLAIRFGGAARAAVLLYTAPAWVAILAAVFLKERVVLRTVFSIAISITGVAMISLSGGGSSAHGTAGLVSSPGSEGLGILFGLVAGLTYALYYILGRKLLERYRGTTLFAWVLPLGALGLLPFVSMSVPTLRAAAALLFIGFASTYCAYAVYSVGLLRLPSSQAAVIATIEPVVAAALAYLFWEEYLGLLGYLGALLVVGGVLLQALPERKSLRIKPES